MRADITEFQKIEELGKKYIEGVRTANISILKEIFHEKASVYGQLNENSKTADTTKPLFEIIEKAGKQGDDFTGRVDILAVEPTIAIFRLVEDNWAGYKFTDYFTCWKCDGVWKIVCKSFDTLPKNK